MNVNKEYWKKLKDKEIVAVLDGDTELEEINDNPQILHLNMPHLTARDIVYKIGNHFNYFIPLKYNGLIRSRWQLFYDLIDKATENNQIQEVLQFIFDKENFRVYIEDELALDISACRKLIPQIQDAAVSRINDVLYTKDLKLTKGYDLISLKAKSSNSIQNLSVNNGLDKAKVGFYILPFEKVPEDMMGAVKAELDSERVNLDLVKAGDIFDSRYKTNIMAEIKDKIRTADVIMADISGKNPNVFFELGCAMTLNKAIIIICNKESFDSENDYDGQLPLDITMNRTIFYEVGFESEREKAQKIVKEIRSILTATPVRVG